MITRGRVLDRETGRNLKGAPPVRVAGLNVPVSFFALSASVLIHGGLLSVAYYTTWAPGPTSRPRIKLPKGERAVQVMVLSTRWPEPEVGREPPQPVDAEDTQEPEVPARLPPAHNPIARKPLEPPVRSVPSKPPGPLGPQEPPGPLEPPAREKRPEPLEPRQPPEPPVPSETAAVEQDAVTIAGTVEEPRARTVEPVSVQATQDSSTLKTYEVSILTEPAGPLLPEALVGFQLAGPKREAVHHSAPQDADVHSTRATRRPEVPRPADPAADAKAGVETGVEVLKLPHPKYPLVSRRLGEEGVVLLVVVVLPNGRAGKVRVLEDPGFARLRKAAIQAVRKARFRPATRRGRPVKQTVRIPFRFVLEKASKPR